MARELKGRTSVWKDGSESLDRAGKESNRGKEQEWWE